jgi:glycosyltransferase involved in cell wall biosynthesis
MAESRALRVAHLVDAMGGSEHLWGKERVVALLMREQRVSGRVQPTLITFSPGLLTSVLGDEGFPVTSLSTRHSRGFDRAIGTLGQYLEKHPLDVIHSHGYRANLVARALRLAGRAPGVRLISTCHGWVESDRKLLLYNAVDRWTTMFSDVTTVPDAGMLPRFSPFGKRRHVLNAVPESETSSPEASLPRAGTFVAGTLGRVDVHKGIPDLLAAAAGFPDPDVVFTVAGAGDLVAQVRSVGGNVRYAGYIPSSGPYLAALDVYIQASRAEGLSLSLLEAMRAGLAIVATDVGATRDAVTDGQSALIVPARRPAALRDAVLSLRGDPELRARLGRAARARFESDFHIRRQHESYLELYQAGERHG